MLPPLSQYSGLYANKRMVVVCTFNVCHYYVKLHSLPFFYVSPRLLSFPFFMKKKPFKVRSKQHRHKESSSIQKIIPQIFVKEKQVPFTCKVFFLFLLRKNCAIRDQLLVHLMYSFTFLPKVITKARPTRPCKWYFEAFLSYLENNSYQQRHKWAFCLYGWEEKGTR